MKKVLDYHNTFAHRRPLLDITNVPPTEFGRYDFVISIDVFEHVPPPVQRAFEGMSRLLKRGSLAVFSAPYTHDEQTTEHFPFLNEYVITKLFGDHCLINKRTDGALEIFDRLTFHGGPGKTLEMRSLTYRHIVDLFTTAGFSSPVVLEEAPEWGIVYDNECSRTLIAYKC